MPTSSWAARCRSTRAATDKAFGAAGGRDRSPVEPGRAAFGVHDVVNENMAGAARVAIAERGARRPNMRCWRPAGRGRVHAWHVARKLGVQRVVCPPGAGAGSTIGMLMAPARVDRVASFGQCAAGRRGLAGGGADIRRPDRGGARRDLRPRAAIWSSADATAGRHALYRPGQRDHRHIAGRAVGGGRAGGVRSRAYRALFARTPPGAAIQFVALRLSVTAPMPGTAQCSVMLHRRTGQEEPVKGRRMVCFAAGDDHDRCVRPLCAAAGYAIDGPAVFEEDESTFVVGPGGRHGCWPTAPSWRSFRHDGAVRSDRAGAAVAAADLHGRRGGGRAWCAPASRPWCARATISPASSPMRPASRWCRRPRASRASSARCRRR